MRVIEKESVMRERARENKVWERVSEREKQKETERNRMNQREREKQ